MRGFVLAGAALLAACGPAEEPAPEPTATATMAAERTLVASDFEPEKFGDIVEGSESEVDLRAMGKPLGSVATSVYCLADGAPCTAEEAPPLYTYVHRVTLAAAPEPAESPSPTPSASASGTPSPTPSIVEIGPTLFRMTRPAPGFNLAVGYSMDEAESALGKSDAIKVTLDREQIVWRVTGGNGWTPGATITVWWQSTLPPESARAYLLEVDGKQADLDAAFPAEETEETQ